jgi:hypothetical protein
MPWDGKYGPGAENPRIIRPKHRHRKYGAHMGAGRDVAHRDVSCRRTSTETLHICLPRQPEARLGSVVHALVFSRRLWGLARCVALTKGRLTVWLTDVTPHVGMSTSPPVHVTIRAGWRRRTSNIRVLYGVRRLIKNTAPAVFANPAVFGRSFLDVAALLLLTLALHTCCAPSSAR